MKVAAKSGIDLATRTIGQLVSDGAAVFGAKPHLTVGEDTYTFVDVLARSAGTAHAFRALGIRKGDRVLVSMGTSADFVFVWLGLMHLGAIMVPINPVTPPSAVERLVRFSRPKALVGDRGTMAGLRIASEDRGLGSDFLLSGHDLQGVAADLPRSRVASGDVAVMISTSGTTSMPKLVMQSHRSCVLAGEGFPSWVGLSSTDTMLTALPLFHMNAEVYSFLGSLTIGASLVLVERFSVSRFWEETRRHEATQFNAIGAMLEMLMKATATQNDANNPVRLCYAAPAPNPDRQREFEKRFGLKITAGYGMSESPYGTVWSDGDRPLGSLGFPRQHPRLGVINEAIVMVNGRSASVGEVGELTLRNPTIMEGYYRMPEETALALRKGWLWTGDLVRLEPDGSFDFVGRSKEMIRRRGENIGPAEVEEALVAHPAIRLAAVVGVPAELSEEDTKAFLVTNQTLDLSELRSWCLARLAPFKVPDYVEFIDELPLTPTGRFEKHRLPTGKTGREVALGSRVPASNTTTKPKKPT